MKINIKRGSNTNKIKIMHIAECAGGVERYLQGLIKYMDHDQFENIVICSQNYKQSDIGKIADSCEVISMEHDISRKDFTTILLVRKLIKKYSPDIVYAHSSKAGVIVRIADIGIKNKCVYNPHGWAFNMRTSGKKQKFYIMAEKILSQLCDKIICISEAEKQSALKKKICSEKKLKIIFSGIDVKLYDEFDKDDEDIKRSDLNISEDAFVVGMVGRLAPQKAPDIFIKMAKQIHDEISNVQFLIVGNGEMQDDIEDCIKKYGLQDTVHITGWVKNPLSYIKLFDVAALLSRWEGFGLVLPEYMICQKPIVATNVDAIPDIIEDHINGLLVPVDDDNKACKAVLEIYYNEKLKEQLVQQGIKDVHEKYDASRMSEEYNEIFKKL